MMMLVMVMKRSMTTMMMMELLYYVMQVRMTFTQPSLLAGFLNVGGVSATYQIIRHTDDNDLEGQLYLNLPFARHALPLQVGVWFHMIAYSSEKVTTCHCFKYSINEFPLWVVVLTLIADITVHSLLDFKCFQCVLKYLLTVLTYNVFTFQ